MLKRLESGKYAISWDEYNHVVDICEKIKDNTDSPKVYDNKIKFTQSNAWPSVEALANHEIEEQFELYFPYLVYYLDVYSSDDPEYKRTEKYIQQLFDEYLEITD